MSLFSFNKKTDYGFLFLTELVRADYSTKQNLETKKYGQISLTRFSKENNLPTKFIEQAAVSLKKAGLVTSKEGKNGGYSLSKDPSQISLLEALVALEGNIAHTECMRADSKCAHEATCKIKHVWRGIGGEIENILKNKTLADIL